jgi:hypothetical protein
MTNRSVLNGYVGASTSVVKSSNSGAILDGFTIQNATFGVSISSGSALITHCDIRSNSYAGIAITGTATVANCNIENDGTDGVDVEYGGTATEVVPVDWTEIVVC